MNSSNTMENQRHNPLNRAEYAEAISTYVQGHIENSHTLRALEVGSSKGATSVLLEKVFPSIDLIDGTKHNDENDFAMMGIEDLDHIHLIKKGFLDFKPEHPYEVVLSTLFLHHIIDTEFVLGKFHTMMATGGRLILCDLYTEDGRSHPNTSEGVYHHGFDPDVLANQLKAIGFAINNIQTIYNFDRNDRLYPMFLIEATKL